MIEKTQGMRMVQIQVINMFNIGEQRNLDRDQIIIMVRACMDASAMFLTPDQIKRVEEDFRFRLQKLEYKTEKGVFQNVSTF